MTPLQAAIAQVQEELKDQGTERQAPEGSTGWWLARARALGLSWLRLAERLEMGERMIEADQHYRTAARRMKVDEPS